MGAGVTLNKEKYGQIPGVSNPTLKQPSIMDAYGAAINTQGSDYDSIMSGYGNQADRQPISPISYGSNPDVTSALSTLKNFSTTGGFSDSDINALRERAISPIRSIYANAQQNLNRNKTISGGYSPGFAGATARMARDQSNLISGKTNDANANIASMVQSGRLASLSPYANLASSEAGRALDTSKFNTSLENEDRNRQLQILQGKNSLYGTNPALVSTFGNQALASNAQSESARQFDLGRMDRNRNNILNMAGRL
jgi:hypothetical protein